MASVVDCDNEGIIRLSLWPLLSFNPLIGIGGQNKLNLL